jgi:arylsulfatase A-like enzyme
MHALGSKRSVTPKLDAYAARSALFRYAFAQGPSTRLSFPALFTSRWDSQIKKRAAPGSRPSAIDDSEQMLAEVLSAEGYDTQAVVPDAYFRRSRWPSLTAGFKQVIDTAAKLAVTHNSAAVTDAALSVINHDRKKPLFLWVHYYDAHSPHVQPADIQPFGTDRSDIYDAELKLVDREVGRLLATIEARHSDNAVVFLTGDHGIAFDEGRHGRFNYGYDLSTNVLHVPLIVAGPQVRTQVLDSIVSTMDIAPTITNLLRIKRPKSFEGASLLPELFSGHVTRPARLVHEFFLEERLWEQREPLEQISLRTDQYNLVHDRVRGVYALYDWRADYLESTNLADVPEKQRELQALKQQLALMTYRVYPRARASAAQAVAKVPGR